MSEFNTQFTPEDTRFLHKLGARQEMVAHMVTVMDMVGRAIEFTSKFCQHTPANFYRAESIERVTARQLSADE